MKRFKLYFGLVILLVLIFFLGLKDWARRLMEI